MGYMKHHTIIVTGGDDIAKAHREAKKIFASIDKKTSGEIR